MSRLLFLCHKDMRQIVFKHRTWKDSGRCTVACIWGQAPVHIQTKGWPTRAPLSDIQWILWLVPYRQCFTICSFCARALAAWNCLLEMIVAQISELINTWVSQVVLWGGAPSELAWCLHTLFLLYVWLRILMPCGLMFEWFDLLECWFKSGVIWHITYCVICTYDVICCDVNRLMQRDCWWLIFSDLIEADLHIVHIDCLSLTWFCTIWRLIIMICIWTSWC